MGVEVNIRKDNMGCRPVHLMTRVPFVIDEGVANMSLGHCQPMSGDTLDETVTALSTAYHRKRTVWLRGHLGVNRMLELTYL